MARNKELTTEERISAEMARLVKIFENIDDDKRQTCYQLIQNAAFMAVSLRDLQKQIQVDGWVETYQNGATQSGKKAGSAAQLYTKLVATFNTVIKNLVALLPKDDQCGPSADLMDEFLDS